MPFIVYDLTSIHISFAILFCQKKVKKNCTSSEFSLKKPE